MTVERCHYKYKYDHTYRTCVSVQNPTLTFPLRFLSVTTFQVAFHRSQTLVSRLICHIKLLVSVIYPVCGADFKATWNEPPYLDCSFSVESLHQVHVCKNKNQPKKKSQHLRIAYQPVCLSISSTMLQV